MPFGSYLNRFFVLSQVVWKCFTLDSSCPDLFISIHYLHWKCFTLDSSFILLFISTHYFRHELQDKIFPVVFTLSQLQVSSTEEFEFSLLPFVTFNVYLCSLYLSDAHASGLVGVATKKQKPKREEERQDRDKSWHVLPSSLQNTKYKTCRKELEDAIE